MWPNNSFCAGTEPEEYTASGCPAACQRAALGARPDKRRGEVGVAIAGFPHHALQRLERGVLAVLVDPALQRLDDHVVAAHAAVLDRDLVEPAAHFRLAAVLAHEAGQRAARIREQHVA